MEITITIGSTVVSRTIPVETDEALTRWRSVRSRRKPDGDPVWPDNESVVAATVAESIDSIYRQALTEFPPASVQAIDDQREQTIRSAIGAPSEGGTIIR